MKLTLIAFVSVRNRERKWGKLKSAIGQMIAAKQRSVGTRNDCQVVHDGIEKWGMAEKGTCRREFFFLV